MVYSFVFELSSYEQLSFNVVVHLSKIMHVKNCKDGNHRWEYQQGTKYHSRRTSDKGVWDRWACRNIWWKNTVHLTWSRCRIHWMVIKNKQENDFFYERNVISLLHAWNQKNTRSIGLWLWTKKKEVSCTNRNEYTILYNYYYTKYYSTRFTIT